MTLVDIQPRTVTPEDLLRMPDSSTMELVDGRIVEKQVGVQSSQIEAVVLYFLQTYLAARPVAVAFPASLGYRCFLDDPDKVRKPDATVVRIERLAAMSDPNPGFMPIVPDLAVEVISPKDLAYEVEEKVHEYLDAGFPLIWLAHPKARTVTVHQQGHKPVIFSESDDLTAEGLLPGFRRKVGEFFPASAVTSKAT